jgi:NAD(P)-dependent dehydrogenase (short-subunit alcohol dehydrogenase family)
MSQPVAIVAGAGAAGAAVARVLAARHHHVVVVDSNVESANRAAEPISARGGSAEAVGLDLLDIDAVQAFRDDLVSRTGRVDVLVHLVGGWRGSATLDRASVENWNALNPPIVGTLAVLTASFGEDVKASPVGRAFMVTSTAAAKPTAGNIAYAAAKSAAEAWMAGAAHFLRDSQARSVVVAVKALLNDGMIAAEPDRQWPGYTHVDTLAQAIGTACSDDVPNGARLDLTDPGYSPA